MRKKVVDGTMPYFIELGPPTPHNELNHQLRDTEHFHQQSYFQCSPNNHDYSSPSKAELPLLVQSNPHATDYPMTLDQSLYQNIRGARRESFSSSSRRSDESEKETLSESQSWRSNRTVARVESSEVVTDFEFSKHRGIDCNDESQLSDSPSSSLYSAKTKSDLRKSRRRQESFV